MKMNQIKTKSVKGNWSYLLFILVFLPLFNLSAQNYVATGGEFYTGNIGYDFTTSTVWQTNRSANPGYYSWGDGATTYTGLSKDNNINGYVKKYGKDAFVFPIGTTGPTGLELRTLSIAARTTGGSATDAYATAWIDGDPTDFGDPTNSNATHPITSVSGVILGVSPLGQWDWQDLTNTGAGLGITVSIPEITETAGVFNQASNLRLVGWDSATSKWVSLGTTGALTRTNYSTLSGTMVAGIQAIGIGASCSAGIIYPTIK
jgi:hypothetical protein